MPTSRRELITARARAATAAAAAAITEEMGDPAVSRVTP